MKIAIAEAWREEFPLSRPYSIATRADTSSVSNFIVRLRDDKGRMGLGSASPEPIVTGETSDLCADTLLGNRLEWLIGADGRTLPALCRELAGRTSGAPAARAAVDMALHDLFGQYCGLPLADVLGRAHSRLETSITIGIKGVEETLTEADEYVGRGFRLLKVKTGVSLEEDTERLKKILEKHGGRVVLRVDANQGYSVDAVERFFSMMKGNRIEFLEQPVKVKDAGGLRNLPEPIRRELMADESLLGEGEALELLVPPRPYGSFNIKLMKCGGIRPGLRIATLAEAGGIPLMWGCMDESRIGIAAALHAAFASPATRYLDLDGSLDLARDVAEGGFRLEDGFMSTTDAPGLGVRLV